MIEWRKNLVWGLKLGFAGAALLSVYVIVLGIVRGTWRLEPYDLSVATLILILLGGGAVVGIFLGLMRPAERLPRSIAMLVGLLGGAALFSAVSYVMLGNVDLVARSMPALLAAFATVWLLWFWLGRSPKDEEPTDD